MVSGVPLLLALFLCSSTGPVAQAGPDEHSYIFVETSSLKPDAVCKGLRVHPSANNHTTGSWVTTSRPHGPCSSSWEEGAGTGTDSASSVNHTLRWDQHRAGFIQRKLSSGYICDEQVELSPCDVEQVSHSGGAISPDVGGSGGSVAKEDAQLGVGPAATGGGGSVKQTMLLDTATDVAWVQCAPCPMSQCYSQADVLYDPTKSGFSAPIPCNSPTCRQLGPYANGCTSDNKCRYRVQYPDGSTTSGTLVSDLLSLTPTTQIGGFQFGCSHAARGRFSRQGAGIMSLGRGVQSLASQAKAGFGPVFSYCFPPTASHHGFFVLGVPRTSRTQYLLTPMLKNAQAPTMYMVRLQAIVVGGQRLNVPPAARRWTRAPRSRASR